MENREYESPKITVISLEPDASLMDSQGGTLPGIGDAGIGGASIQPPEPSPSNNELPTAL